MKPFKHSFIHFLNLSIVLIIMACSPSKKHDNKRLLASLEIADTQQTLLYAGEKYPGPNESKYSGEAVYTSDGTDLIEIQNYTTQHGVVIKGEEGDTSDGRMTEKTKEKVLDLASKVQNEWSGVYLRITEAWDTNNEHSNYSLHYEGRAIDITTSDRDADRLAKLAGMAIASGFDWVYNEGDHVHVSVKK